MLGNGDMRCHSIADQNRIAAQESRTKLAQSVGGNSLRRCVSQRGKADCLNMVRKPGEGRAKPDVANRSKPDGTEVDHGQHEHFKIAGASGSAGVASSGTKRLPAVLRHVPGCIGGRSRLQKLADFKTVPHVVQREYGDHEASRSSD